MLAGAFSAGPAAAGPPPKPHAPLTIAVYGDSPYGTSPTDTAEFNQTPQLVQSINSDPDVSLVLHLGDIHSGSQYCTEAYDRSIYDLWTKFTDPLVYTPGDNELPQGQGGRWHVQRHHRRHQLCAGRERQPGRLRRG
jgi:hypothetical protein